METPSRAWFQYRLRSILWLLVCVAVGFAAYRRGFDDGFVDGANSRAYVGQAYLMAYYVKDLLPQKPLNGKPVETSSDSLIQEITTNVLPNTWDKNGGQAVIRSLNNRSLVVSHDRDGHNQIAACLKQRRDSTSQLATRK